MTDRDFYKILGVSAAASQEEIKKAYKKKAKQYHPDRNKNDKSAEEQFKKISAAYAVLGDKEKRQLYDKFGIDGLRDGFNPHQWQDIPGGFGNVWTSGGGYHQARDFGGFQGFGALEDIFESLFGSGTTGGNRGRKGGAGWRYESSPARKEPEVRLTLEIEFMDMVLGRELQIIVPVNGEQKKLKVVVPKGIETGQAMRLKGQGGRNPNTGRDRDLLLDIRVKEDPVYKRDGLDIIKDEHITVGQSYNGGEKKVDTPWGKVKIAIPRGTQGGKKLRLKGKGLKKNDRVGDLYLNLYIKFPRERNEEIQNAVAEIEKHYLDNEKS